METSDTNLDKENFYFTIRWAQRVRKTIKDKEKANHILLIVHLTVHEEKSAHVS